MPAFGPVTCDLIKGIPEAMREKVVEYSVLGVDGHGFHKIGKRGNSYSIRLIKYGDKGAVSGFFDSIHALEGTTQSYNDDLDHTSVPHMVESIGRPVIGAAIHEGGYRGEINVTIRPLA